MSDDLFKVDTKGICLLCLTPTGEDPLVKDSSSANGFKQLLRFLNVNNRDLVSCEKSVGVEDNTYQEVNVVITMCKECLTKAKEFQKVYAHFELIKQQLNNCVASIHESIMKGDVSPQRTSQFKEIMKPKTFADSINSRLGLNLRAVTRKKCADKLQSYQQPSNLLTPSQLEGMSEFKENTFADSINSGLGLNLEAVPRKKCSDKLQTYHKISNVLTPPSQLKAVSGIQSPEASIVKPGDDTSDIEIVKVKLSSTIPSSYPTTKHVCQFCDKKFNGEYGLKIHKAVVHTEHHLYPHLSSLGTLPEVKSILKILFTQIIVRRHYQSPMCTYCKKSFPNYSTLKYHLVLLHKTELVKLANAISAGQCKLAKQRRTNKLSTPNPEVPRRPRTVPIPRGPKQCDICSTQTLALKQHRYINHPECFILPHLSPAVVVTNEKCKQLVFSAFDGMKLVSDAGPTKGKGKFRCSYCTSKFFQLHHLKAHVLIHHVKEFSQDVEQELLAES